MNLLWFLPSALTTRKLSQPLMCGSFFLTDSFFYSPRFFSYFIALIKDFSIPLFGIFSSMKNYLFNFNAIVITEVLFGLDLPLLLSLTLSLSKSEATTKYYWSISPGRVSCKGNHQ
jgi:hypothetical protein